MTRTRSRLGFTLLELTIAIAVLGVVMWMAGILTISSGNAFDGSSLRQIAENDARRALDRAVSELATAGETTLLPNPALGGGTSRLDFRQASGVAAGVVVWGPLQRFELELTPGEPNNGVDDNGDGAVDERVLVLWRDVGGAGEQRVVLCRGVRELLEGEAANVLDDNGNGFVDEPGFHVSRAGDVLTLRLTVENRGRGNDGAVATVETSTRLRMRD